jgi:hypothetical protein
LTSIKQYNILINKGFILRKPTNKKIYMSTTEQLPKEEQAAIQAAIDELI